MSPHFHPRFFPGTRMNWFTRAIRLFFTQEAASLVLKTEEGLTIIMVEQQLVALNVAGFYAALRCYGRFFF